MCSLVLEKGLVANRSRHLSVGCRCSSGCCLSQPEGRLKTKGTTRLCFHPRIPFFSSLSTLSPSHPLSFSHSVSHPAQGLMNADSYAHQCSAGLDFQLKSCSANIHRSQVLMSITTPKAYPNSVFPIRCANTPPSREKSFTRMLASCYAYLLYVAMLVTIFAIF